MCVTQMQNQTRHHSWQASMYLPSTHHTQGDHTNIKEDQNRSTSKQEVNGAVAIYVTQPPINQLSPSAAALAAAASSSARIFSRVPFQVLRLLSSCSTRKTRLG